MAELCGQTAYLLASPSNDQHRVDSFVEKCSNYDQRARQGPFPILAVTRHHDFVNNETGAEVCREKKQRIHTPDFTIPSASYSNDDMSFQDDHKRRASDTPIISSSTTDTLFRRIHRLHVEAPRVSEGFWRSMQLTPGELSLKNNRQKLSRTSQRKERKKAGLSGMGASSARMTDPEDIPLCDLMSGHKDSDEDHDPDRISMAHIVKVLTAQNCQSSRQEKHARVREDIMMPISTDRPLTTVEMALKTSRRYRHPERQTANFPSSPRAGIQTVDASLANNCWACNSSALELALKHKSVTYCSKQRSKMNRYATGDDMMQFRERFAQTPVVRSYTMHTLGQARNGTAPQHGSRRNTWSRAVTFYRPSLQNTSPNSEDKKGGVISCRQPSGRNNSQTGSHPSGETIRLPSLSGGVTDKVKHADHSTLRNNQPDGTQQALDKLRKAPDTDKNSAAETTYGPPCNTPTDMDESENSSV